MSWTIHVLWLILGWCLQLWCSFLWNVHPGTARSYKARRTSRACNERCVSRPGTAMPAERAWDETNHAGNNRWTERCQCIILIVEPTLHHIIDNSWQCVRLACSSRSDREEWRALFFAPSPLSECLCSVNWGRPCALNLGWLSNPGRPGFDLFEKKKIFPYAQGQDFGASHYRSLAEKALTEHLLVKIAAVSAWRSSMAGFSYMN